MDNITTSSNNSRTVYLADLVLERAEYPEPMIDYFAHTRQTRRRRQRRPIKLTLEWLKIKRLGRKWTGVRMSKWTMVRAVLILAVLAISGYLAIDTWMINRKLDPGGSASAAAGTSDSDRTFREEAEEELSGAISEGGGDRNDFAFAGTSNTIGRIIIPSIGVNARILAAGLDSQGHIMAPATAHDTTWFTGSAQPGSPGAAFISGHAGVRIPEIFARIAELGQGDRIILEMSDGTRLTYSVLDVRTYPLQGLNMQEALSVLPGHASGLNLMTCSGTFIPQMGTFDHRTVVFAAME